MYKHKEKKSPYLHAVYLIVKSMVSEKPTWFFCFWSFAKRSEKNVLTLLHEMKAVIPSF